MVTMWNSDLSENPRKVCRLKSYNIVPRVYRIPLFVVAYNDETSLNGDGSQIG